MALITVITVHSSLSSSPPISVDDQTRNFPARGSGTVKGLLRLLYLSPSKQKEDALHRHRPFGWFCGFF